MSVSNKRYFSLFVCGIICFAAVAEPLFGQASSDPTSYGMTSGRLVATLAAVLGVIGVVIGGFALAGRLGSSGRYGAIACGLIAAAVGGLRVATAGGIGTGGGRAGAIIALVLGLIAIGLGVFALARSKSEVTENG